MDLKQIREAMKSGNHDLIAQAQAAKSEIINRVGKKIALIRNSRVMSSDQFVAFRNKLYSLPEEDREAEVDRVILLNNIK